MRVIELPPAAASNQLRAVEFASAELASLDSIFRRSIFRRSIDGAVTVCATLLSSRDRRFMREDVNDDGAVDVSTALMLLQVTAVGDVDVSTVCGYDVNIDRLDCQSVEECE